MFYIMSFFQRQNDFHLSLTIIRDEEKDNQLPLLDVLIERIRLLSLLVYIERLRSLACIWVGMHLLQSIERLTWSNVLQWGLLRSVLLTKLNVNLNRLRIYFRVTGILRKLLLTLWTKLLISLGKSLYYLALQINLFMSDFLELDLQINW